jgi:hypothetical protein
MSNQLLLELVNLDRAMFAEKLAPIKTLSKTKIALGKISDLLITKIEYLEIKKSQKNNVY